ncbi:serine hydrolase domain-containing protein [Aquipuribacter hungaricus]|uniref:Serine hydrolase domain-containing protein n=1 Tax=Aquipuribacter hungaricus TaxID=545624 RepID=A0ABV7WGQ0_9MICO
MTSPRDPTVPVRALLDGWVASGRVPGYVVALRHAGTTHVLHGGTADAAGAVPVTPATVFRLSSVSKLVGAVLALALVDDGTLGLDDPVGTWLPGLASPGVLRDRLGPLDDVVPAERPVTVRHLLTGTSGWGGIWEPCPLAEAVDRAGVGPGPWAPDLDPETYVDRLAGIPLAAQPGTTWLYHVGSDLLGVVLARAAGRPVSELLRDRVTGPLGLGSTGFWAPAERLSAAWWATEDGGLRVVDTPDGRFSRPPAFESLAAGLVSTAEDVLGLLTAVADGGGGVLRPATVAEMTRDQLTPGQRAGEQEFLGAGVSWGLHVGVDVGQDPAWGGPGRWGWDGGTGTSAWVDPGRDVAAVVLTQRGMLTTEDSLEPFWRAVAAGVG